MPSPVKIFVEGVADVKFISDYISYIYPNLDIEENAIVNSEGWTNNREKTENQMRLNTDNGGINLVIFDADTDFDTRKGEIEQWRIESALDFETFLFPNNRDIGALEELLENIILDRNQPIFDCWSGYERCLQSKEIDGRVESLTTPAKKTKIYGYLEALLGTTKREKEQIKERERNYKNMEHWNLDSEFLNPLKHFLLTVLRKL